MVSIKMIEPGMMHERSYAVGSVVHGVSRDLADILVREGAAEIIGQTDPQSPPSGNGNAADGRIGGMTEGVRYR